MSFDCGGSFKNKDSMSARPERGGGVNHGTLEAEAGGFQLGAQVGYMVNSGQPGLTQRS